MSIYPSPNYTQPLSIFNRANYGDDGTTITKAYLDANYLKYPVAQAGTETLNTAIVNGTLTANSSTTLNGAVSIPNNDMFVRNIRIGYGTGTGVNNVIVGDNCGINSTTGAFNVFLGSNSGLLNTTGTKNTFLGSFSGRSNTSGGFNTAVGQDAGNNNVSGNRNTFLGREAGLRCLGSDNICIGNESDCSGNLNFSMAIGSGVKTTTSNTIVLGTSSQTTQIAGPVSLNSNNNLTMTAGTGSIQQPIVVGDTSTKNNFRLSDFAYNGNNASGTAVKFDFYDNFAGRGLSIMPDAGQGNFGSTTRLNDCVLFSRVQNSGAITISNWNDNLRNGLRVFTTDSSNCGLTLQCGQNLTNDWTEFRMSYTRTGGVNTTTTTFNNVINFNPTGGGALPLAVTGARRQLIGLGTLSFTDISGNNSTNGSFTSAIWTDSSLVSGLGRGMFLDCSINGGDIIFRTNDTSGVKSTSLALNGDLNTTYNRVYQEIQPTWNKVNGFYELAKDCYPSLNPISSGVASVSTWTTRTTSIDLEYYSVAWSAELGIFVAVSQSGSGGTGIDRVITSPDGITWTQRNSFAQNWRYVMWAPELKLFVSLCVSGTTTQRVMTSPDGINWTLRTTPNDNNWRQVCWSPELNLLVAVADTGTDRVMTSPDGITWTSVNQGNAIGWNGICWSAELGIFVAVGNSGTGTRVMTSPNGTTWTLRTSAADNTWRSVVWASEIGLFVAIASSGVNNRVMTSTNGINWTIRTTNSNGWREICWSPELKLFCAVSDDGTSNRVMTSPDGINWTLRTTPNDNNWRQVCWSPELNLLVAVADTGTLS